MDITVLQPVIDVFEIDESNAVCGFYQLNCAVYLKGPHGKHCLKLHKTP